MHLLIFAVLCFAVTPGRHQAQSWQQFSSIEGKFSASMPAEPTVGSMSTNTKDGIVLTHTVSSSDDNLNEFMVSWTEYKSSEFEKRGTEATFGKIRDALVAANHGKVVSESAISAGSHPARALTISKSDGRIIAVRFYFVGNRFYQVMAQTKPENTGDVERFFESFSFMPGTLV